jgi:hypothetical protein
MIEKVSKTTAEKLLEVHGDGACHICGQPKSGVGSPICSYPHGMLPVTAVDADHPEGFWTWKIVPVFILVLWVVPAWAFTAAEEQAYSNRTGITRENACLLNALNMTPCDDSPQRPKAQRGWGDGHPKTYNINPR